MGHQFWAVNITCKQKVGPHPTREKALAAFREAYPFKGKSYMARAPRNLITTGYGIDGPSFNIQWHSQLPGDH